MLLKSIRSVTSWHQGSNPRASAHQMQRTRLWYMSLNLLVGGEIRYTTRGESNRTVGREWLHKYGNVRADGSSSHCGCEGPRFEPCLPDY